MPREVRAFAPGRVNLIGEHTDYNGGLALPFAIAEGITVHGRSHVKGASSETRRRDGATARAPGKDDPRIRVRALDLDEEDEFVVGDRTKAKGWRVFVHGMAAELRRCRIDVPAADLWITGNLARGAGLSSSAALEISLGLALLALSDAELDRCELARLCSRVENDWVGARTGLLDQLASLFGQTDTALYIDFAEATLERVPFQLGDGWQMVTVSSAESRELAASIGYNERRAECRTACEMLGIESLRQASDRDLGRLPDRLARRVRHVLSENLRVQTAVAALRDGNLRLVGSLLNASHASLRDQYECSTPAVEAVVQRLLNSGAAGARMVGGGFGGSVLALFPPGGRPPRDTREVRPAQGARLLPAS